MILIFEGLDRSGKDTQISLIKQFLADKPLMEVHYTKIDGLPPFSTMNNLKMSFQKMFDRMFEAIINDDEHIILNRFHLGEYVYGYLYRGYDPNYIFDLEDEFFAQFCSSFLGHLSDLEYHVKIFYLDIDPITSLTRDDGKSLSTGTSTEKLEKISQERSRFREAIGKSSFPTECKKIIDCTNKSIVGIHSEISKEVQKMKGITPDAK